MDYLSSYKVQAQHHINSADTQAVSITSYNILQTRLVRDSHNEIEPTLIETGEYGGFSVPFNI